MKRYAVLFLFLQIIWRTVAQIIISTINSTDDAGTFIVGSEVIVVCEIQSYHVLMNWKINSTRVGECTLTQCSPTSNLPEHYTFSYDTNSGIFNLTINPVQSSDNGQVLTCENENVKDTATLTVTVKERVNLIFSTGRTLYKRKCILLLGFGYLVYWILLWQTTCAGCMLYYIYSHYKSEVFKVLDCGCLAGMCFVNFPLFGLFVLAYLANKQWDKVRTDKKKKYYCKSFQLLGALVPVFGAIFIVYKLRTSCKNGNKACFVILSSIAIVIVAGMPLITLPECWNLVTDHQHDHIIIVVIVFGYLFGIFFTVLVLLLYLQHNNSKEDGMKLEEQTVFGIAIRCLPVIGIIITCAFLYCKDKQLQVKFIETLTDMKVKEKDTLTLSCKLNKDRPLQWFKDGKKIEPNNRTKVSVNGFKHQLVVTNATLFDGGTYSCVFGDVSIKCTVQVEELQVQFTETLTDLKVKENDTLTLSCKLNTDIPVQWFKDRKKIKPNKRTKVSGNGFQNQLVVTDATFCDGGTYRCVCGVVSTECTVQVEELPVQFTETLTNMKVKENDTLTFSCKLNKEIPVQWFKDRKIIKPNNRTKVSGNGFKHQLVVTDATLCDGGTYRCVCGVVSTECTVHVEELQVQFTETLTDLKVKEEDTLILSCKLNKDWSVKWLKNCIEIEPNKRTKVSVDQYQHQLVVTDATMCDGGTYSCVCEGVSTECTVQVEELPVQFTETLTDLKVKEKDTLTLSCKLNKDIPVKWLKNSIEIKPNERTKVSVDQYKHQLVITDATLCDGDKYSCVCGDVSTECTVQVEEAQKRWTTLEEECLNQAFGWQIRDRKNVSEFEIRRAQKQDAVLLDISEAEIRSKINNIVKSKKH